MARRLELLGALIVATLLIKLAVALPHLVPKRPVAIRGSDSAQPLVAAWASEFNGEAIGVDVSVTGGGSTSGISAFLSGGCDLAMCSRPMRAAEAAAARGHDGPKVEVPIAIAAVAVAVNPLNPLSDLTLADVADIFAGRKQSWRELGGPDRPIRVLASPPGTGPYAFLRDHAIRLGDDALAVSYGPSVTFLADPASLAACVASDRDAVAALELSAVAADVKTLRIAERRDREPVAPSIDAAAEGRYPLARPLLLYAASPLSADIGGFVTFCRSDRGQEIARSLGFIPLR
ncbi:MAG TPA: substrate-binding domain-containing protein, partial [Planctomycetota bacterium]|nr:substrate-binding domain-containing protein [Planctomycetota bacterium]